LWNAAELEVPSVASMASERYFSGKKVTRARNGTDGSEIILKMFL
jgi:hypothetical protein